MGTERFEPNVAFTIGPLTVDEGAGLTIAAAGLARALVRSGAARVTVFGRRPKTKIDYSVWAPAEICARGRPAARFCEFDPDMAAAVGAGAPDIIHSHGLWLAHQWSARRAANA